MKRIALIAASGAAALAATLAVAQPQPIPPAAGSQQAQQRVGSEGERAERGERGDRREEWRQRQAERATARMNERFAKLRTDLKLKPEQVPAFEKVETLVKRNAEQRRERFAAMREQRETFRHADIMERLDMMASGQMERATRSKELADAVRPLWTTLSDEQKTVARRAVREAMADGRSRMMEMRERRQEWRGDDDDDRGQRRGRDRDRRHDHDRDRGYDSDRF